MNTTTQDAPQIIPLGDRVILRVIDPAIKSGLIIIPGNAQERPNEAEVMAIGPGQLDTNGQRFAPDVAVGDRVIFGKYSGSEARVFDRDLLIVREHEIMAVVEHADDDAQKTA